MNKRRDLLIWKNQILGHTKQAETLKVDEADEVEEEEVDNEALENKFGDDDAQILPRVSIGKTKKKGEDEEKTFSNMIAGIVFRTFSDIDLQQLKDISKAIEQRQKITNIDDESILCTFKGQTMFSIFKDNIEVFEQIRDQLKTKKIKP